MTETSVNTEVVICHHVVQSANNHMFFSIDSDEQVDGMYEHGHQQQDAEGCTCTTLGF
jgi:hypothetical protein